MMQKPRTDKHHCQEQSNKGNKQREGIRTLAEQFVSRRLNCRHKHHCREGIIQHQVIQTRDLISIEFSGRFLWQPNTAVRCRIVRHYACVHSEVETTQTHEIWHVHFVDGGPMVPLFVGDYEMTGARGVAWPPG